MRLFRTGDVAALLGVHAATVREWDANGRLVANRTVGGHRVYDLENILLAVKSWGLPDISARLTDVCWAAGFLDGEGCFTVTQSLEVPRRDLPRITPRHRIVVDAVNTKRAPIEKLLSIFGGSIRLIVRKNPRHRPVWRWQIGSERAVCCIRALRPFLVVKQEVADLVVEYAKTVKNVGCAGHTATTFSRRLEIVGKIRTLNARGQLLAG